jgi:hypothetical protein
MPANAAQNVDQDNSFFLLDLRICAGLLGTRKFDEGAVAFMLDYLTDEVHAT